MAQEFWPALPVILEHEHYGLQRTGPGQAVVAVMRSKSIMPATCRFTVARGIFAENRDIIDQINPADGYRLHPVR
jgi:hypothetical protein